MKISLLAIAAAMIMTATAHARIGWTLEQCRSNYGHEVKVEKAWCGGTAYSFINDGLYIYTILSPDGKVGDITYFDNRTAKPFSQDMQAHLWLINIDKSRMWDGDNYFTFWDGKKSVKKLGVESFPHRLMYETNGPNVMIENANKNGWQIRTKDQFEIEQSALKARSSVK
jgi:hypothetical protein